jgi:hypothetical protein
MGYFGTGKMLVAGGLQLNQISVLLERLIFCFNLLHYLGLSLITPHFLFQLIQHYAMLRHIQKKPYFADNSAQSLLQGHLTFCIM